MALSATIHRVELDVADVDRGYYAQHSLTVARHPSETEERLMLRLLAFALHADPSLEFGRGISGEDDAELWAREDNGEIRLWIELGLPDERRLRRAAGRAAELVLIAYGGRSGVDLWWERNRETLARLPRLRVIAVAQETLRELGALAARNMKLQVTIQDGNAWVSDATRSLAVEPRVLRAH